MARPIWAGTLSFGLLNIPVSLMPGERKSRISFRMLDARDKSAVRYDRVNAETGEQVPWKEIVKAYEYEKGKYVVLEPEDIKSAAPLGKEAVEIEAFVDEAAIAPQYFEKPYILVPGKKAEKGYVLLRQTLKSTGKIGIGRVVIRAREYLCAVMPEDDALLLMLLRFEQELVDISEYKLPAGNAGEYRVSEKELAMAKQLIGSMADKWQPEKFRDEFEERLNAVIKKRMKSKGAIASIEKNNDADEDATTNVVDFMSLLQKSLASNKRTPAKASKSPAKKVAKAPAKVAAKSSATKKAAARRSA